MTYYCFNKEQRTLIPPKQLNKNNNSKRLFSVAYLKERKKKNGFRGLDSVSPPVRLGLDSDSTPVGLGLDSDSAPSQGVMTRTRLGLEPHMTWT